MMDRTVFETITIGDRPIIVAELGNNHEGDIDVAREMVRQAAICGADAVKLQTFRTEHYVGRSDRARFERLKAFELAPVHVVELAGLARSLGLLFVSTPFDLESARLLEPLVDAFKIASGDLSFYPLLKEVARTGRPVILSSGASDLATIAGSVAYLRDQWRTTAYDSRLVVLHCVSSYPTPSEEANLRAISSLALALNLPIGYSDHTLGLDAVMAAVALGACLIEKHFTLDKETSDFRDHRLSADPNEMRDLVQRCRMVHGMLGTGEKQMQPCERSGVDAMRRSIVAACSRPAGHILTAADLTWTRPAGGLAPGQEHQLLGTALRRDVAAGDWLLPGDVE